MPKPNSNCRAIERKHPWPMVRLGDVCEVVLGGTPKTGITEYWDGDIPWLTPGDMGKITQLYVDASNCKRKISQLGLDNGSTLCPARSVILSTRAPIGYAFVNSVPMATNQGCKTLVPSDDVSPEYLCFNLLGRTDELNELGTGTTFKELATGRLKAMPLPLPPLSIQREIVARLELELAAVEKIKKDFEALAETAKAEFKAELKEVFEEISRGGAETRRLGEICELISDCPHTTAKDEGVGIPLIRTPNVGFTRLILAGVHRVSEDVYKQRTKRAIPLPGDLIFAREAPAGNVAVIQSGEKVCLGQRTVLLRLRKGCFSDYIAYSVLQPESQKILIQRSTGSTVAHVNVCDIKTFPIHIPPLSVQREVVARLDAAKARAEKLEAKAREGVAVCETMRKAILKEAFEGG